MESANLEALKDHIQASTLLTPTEKEEWVYLLPRMNEEQIRELEHILSIQLPENGTGVQIKKQEPQIPRATTPAVPRTLPSTPIKQEDRIPQTKPQSTPIPRVVSPAVSLKKINLSDLETLSAEHLKQEPSPEVFLKHLLDQIRDIQRTGGLSISQIEDKLAQSPLFQTYLEAGLKSLSGAKPENLSKPEFEAITDFRRGLRLLH